jgi:hypothetical protein
MAVNAAASAAVKPVSPAEPGKQDGGKAKKDRSPPYPAIRFVDALALAKKVWDRDKKHPMSAELIAKCLDYKSAQNGAFIPVLSAMKKYGVIVPSGEEFRVSDEAAAVFIHPEGAPERLALTKRLAMMPAIFTKVLAKYGNDLPSNETLRAKLRLDFGFASDEAADTLIGALRASMAIAGLDHEAPVEQNAGDSNADEEPAMVEPQKIANPVNQPPGAPPASPANNVQGKPEKHTVKLDDGAWAEIIITGTPDQKAKERLAKYVKHFIIGED